MRIRFLPAIFLFFATFSSAVTFERITFVSRQSSLFVGNVRSALNSKTGTTLVIWDRNNGTKHTVWAGRVDSDGSPSGSRFQLVKGPNAQAARLTYNPDQNEFLLVYANEKNGSGKFQIYAQRLNGKGKRIGKPILISPATDHGLNIYNYWPQTIYDAVNQSYLVIWTRYALDNSVSIEDGLYGALLASDLSTIKAPVLIAPLQGDFTNVRGPNVTDIGFHPTNGKLLLSGWTRSTEIAFTFQYFVATADATLTKPFLKFSNTRKTVSSGAAPYAELMFLPGNKIATLFVEGTGVKKRSINAKGRPSGPTSFFFSGSLQSVPLEFPVSALGTNTTASETAVVAIDDSSTGTGKIWLQTANASGTASGQPFELQANLDIGASPEIFSLPNPPSGLLYAVIFVEGVRKNPPEPNESSGLVLLKVNTP